MEIQQLYRVLSGKSRLRRMRLFERVLGVHEGSRILDVGGTLRNWRHLSYEPAVTILNLDHTPEQQGRFTMVVGDGRNLQYSDGEFEIVFSNSVVEHVGDWDDQMRFAAEIRRVGERYFVQTPNRWFFIEPHVLTPLIHFLPKRVQRRLLRYTLWGLTAKPDQAYIDNFLETTRLVTVAEMRQLFPDATIIRERWLGMTKSIVAVGPEQRSS